LLISSGVLDNAAAVAVIDVFSDDLVGTDAAAALFGEGLLWRALLVDLLSSVEFGVVGWSDASNLLVRHGSLFCARTNKSL
jgi:hypothetical protein